MSFGNVPESIMKELASKEKPIVVIGASNSPEKYGNKIVKNLLAKGYKVIPVNPKETMVEGIPAYASVADVPQPVAFLNFVVPPKAALQVLDGAAAAGFDAVWFQDGSFDDAVLLAAGKAFSTVVSGACVMVVTNLA